MPELPEVETVKRGLERYLTDARLVKVEVRRGDLRVPAPGLLGKTLEGHVLQRIDRRAKYLLLCFDNRQVLIVHLGMSGSLVLKPLPAPAPRKHDHVMMTWGNGLSMAFHDPRRFGLMLLCDEAHMKNHPLFAHLGPEPLDAGFNMAYLYKVLHASASPVKTVLMDQRKLVGVGNIYASEALFRARVRPTRRANQVTKKEAAHLVSAIREVLEAAIASGGSTLRDYVRSSGDGGYFQHHFNVYGKQGKPCSACGRAIRMVRQSGRSTYFCPHCQR